MTNGAGSARPGRAAHPGEPRVADYVSGLVRIFEASTTCGRLDEVLRSDPTIRCVAVRGADGALGLIGQDAFIRTMTGPFGFGRALLARQQVGALADWDPLTLAPDTPVDLACHALRQRRPEKAYDDLLVRYSADRVGRVPAAAILDSVALRCADQADSDPLTGLANRRQFLRRLDDLCRRAAVGECQVVVAFLDLDGMKRVNDTLGHEAGDAILVAVAEGLRRAAPRASVVARLGGDEFAVVVRASTTADSAVGLGIGERLRRATAEADPGTGSGAAVRASVGVAVGAGPVDARTVLSTADALMYQAKRGGGDRVALASVPAPAEVRRDGGGSPTIGLAVPRAA